MGDTNPFFSPSTLPHGLPPFGDIRPEHFREAFERGFAEQLDEVDAIVSLDEPATVENTLLPLERSGQLLGRVSRVFFNKSSADSDDFSIALEEELAPRMAAHSDAIRLNPLLYARVAALRAASGVAGSQPLDEETYYLIERCHTGLTRAGAGLAEPDKHLLRSYNSELATLTTRFEKHLLADTNELAVVVRDVAELDGLDAGEISATAAAAAERGLEGSHLIPLVLPTGHPYLASLTNRDLRRRIMEASRSRGNRGGPNDNRALVVQIARLRAQRAALLGYESHAAYVTADSTAGTPANVLDMLSRLSAPAARNARAEMADLEAELAAERAPTPGSPGAGEGDEHAGGETAGGRGGAFRLEAWDWAFASERVRKARFDVDAAAMRPYFEAERVLRDGVFFAATRLYGVTFAERPDLVGYHPEVRVFEVSNEDGSSIGLYLLDLYTRDSKRGGAWMNSLISQSTLLDTPTVVVNNLNVPKPAAGEPTLLTFDLVNTLFHEFGHALHGLFATVTYPRFSGTSVFRDFVEFPSQVNEMWMLWPEVLENYAVHYRTGERMPRELVERLRESERFNEGFATSEYLAAALLDQAWHNLGPEAFEQNDAFERNDAFEKDALGGRGASAANQASDGGPAVTDVAAFESAALAAAGLDNPAVPPRYASTYFAHTFSGGYAAAYYSYIWSEVLDADTVEWFEENGGLTRENGDRFRERLLGVGGSKDPLDAYRDFRGRDAVIEPLLKRRGLVD